MIKRLVPGDSFINLLGIDRNYICRCNAYMIYPLRILQRFNFRQFKDSNGKRHIESIDYWVTHILIHIFDEEVQHIIINGPFSILEGLFIIRAKLIFLNILNV